MTKSLLKLSKSSKIKFYLINFYLYIFKFCSFNMLIMLNKLREKSSLIGIFWMIVTTIFFVGVTIFVKILGEKIPSSQTAIFEIFI